MSSYERTYHVGDAFPPLIGRFAYGPDSGLNLADDLTPALAYTFSMWPTTGGPPVINAQAASCDSATGNLVQLRRVWGATDLATPGRYVVRFATTVGGKAVWLPGEGRDLYVVVLPLVD